MTDLEIHSDEKKMLSRRFNYSNFQWQISTQTGSDGLCIYAYEYKSFQWCFFMTYVCSSELCGHQAPITINLHQAQCVARVIRFFSARFALGWLRIRLKRTDHSYWLRVGYSRTYCLILLYSYKISFVTWKMHGGGGAVTIQSHLAQCAAAELGPLRTGLNRIEDAQWLWAGYISWFTAVTRNNVHTARSAGHRPSDVRYKIVLIWMCVQVKWRSVLTWLSFYAGFG